MKLSMISSLALGAAMLLSTGAMAQTMVGGQSVSAEDLPKVEAQCAALVAAQTNSTGGVTNTDVDGGSDSDEAEAPQTADPAASDADGANQADQATATIDLDVITLEDCKAANLGGAM